MRFIPRVDGSMVEESDAYTYAIAPAGSGWVLTIYVTRTGEVVKRQLYMSLPLARTAAHDHAEEIDITRPFPNPLDAS